MFHISRALLERAIELGVKPPRPELEESDSGYEDLSLEYGLSPNNSGVGLANLGWDDLNNQQFSVYFGHFYQQPQQLVQQFQQQVQSSPVVLPSYQIVHQMPEYSDQHLDQQQVIQVVQQPPLVKQHPPQQQVQYILSNTPMISAQPQMQQPATAPRFQFAPPSELPSSFKPIRVAKLPEITMDAIEAASAASKPSVMLSNIPASSHTYIEPINSAPPIKTQTVQSIIKRPEPPFSGTNMVAPLPKRFRQTEFTLTTMQRLLFCEICRGIVQEREALRIHLFWAHRIGLPPSIMMNDEWYSVSCPSCGRGFYTPDGFEQHRAIGCYNDIFVPTFCVVCHRFQSTSSMLCAHLAREHGLTPPSMTKARVCFLCSSSFDSEEHTSQHLLLGHQVTTEPNNEREDFINVIWQGQLVASVDPHAIGAEAAAAMVSLQAANVYNHDQDEEVQMFVERIDSNGNPAGGLGAIGGVQLGGEYPGVQGVASANRALFFAARGGVAAPLRRGPGRPPLRGPGRPRGSRARGPYRPRGTGPTYRARGPRLPGARGPGRPRLSNTSVTRRKMPRGRGRAPKDASSAGKAKWFHEEFSLSETDDEDVEVDPEMGVLEPDEPDPECYDEASAYAGDFYADQYDPQVEQRHRYY